MKISKQLSVVLVASLIAIMAGGCSSQKSSKSKESNQASIIQKILTEFTKPNVTEQLNYWDSKLLPPILERIKQLQANPNILKQEKWKKESLQAVNGAYKELAAETAIRMNDEYLYFAKKLLLAFKDNLEKTNGNIDSVTLEDASMAFANARSKTFGKGDLYKFNNFDQKQLHKGISYVEIRKLLNMPGVHLKPYEIPAIKGNSQPGKYEPILWVYNDKFLYVEFMQGKAVDWKYYETPTFGTTKDKKVLEEVKNVEKDIMQPAIALYKEYIDKKNALGKQKIYNEKAAKHQADWLKDNIPSFKVYREKLKAVSNNDEATKQYYRYAALYLQQVEERLLCSQNMLDAKTSVVLRTNINRANNLEGRLIWDTRYIYENARSWLLGNKMSFRLPLLIEPSIAKKPWDMNLTHWFLKPSVPLKTYFVVDGNNSKKIHRHSHYVWNIGNMFFYGVFLDNRLLSCEYRCLKNGFYNY